ncbi:MAG TPA: hypothetical protein VFA12_18245 [Stellaceae bacterium]|nr:hypothetical protein [Stellaceae bacterium]
MKKDTQPPKSADEQSVIEEVAKEVPPPDAVETDSKVQSPVTSTGLPVEEQVRKEWDPKKAGLPTF